MFRLYKLLFSAQIPTGFLKQSISLRRDLSTTECLMNEINTKSLNKKGKSHKSKTLYTAFTDSLDTSKKNFNSLEGKLVKPVSDKTHKQKALDAVNLGPRKPDNWRKMKDLPEWKRQKFALIEKFKGEKWDPKKKLSRQDMKSVKLLKQNLPEITTTELSEHFAVSPEAIRRILKSKWEPTTDEETEIDERWKRRGEKIKAMMKEKHIPKTPKLVINSTDGYTKVKFSKKNDLHIGNQEVKKKGAHKRIQKVGSKNSLRKMKF